MMRKCVFRTLALASVVSATQFVLANDTSLATDSLPGDTVAKTAANVKKLTSKQRVKVIDEIAAKEAAIKELSAKAKVVNEGMQKLASSNVANNEESATLMKAMLKELQDMNSRLQKLEEDVSELKGWKEGQDEALPVIAGDVDNLKRFKPSFYTQFQYRDSNQRGSDNSFAGQHGFNLRRYRIGATYVIDSRTEAKISFDGATGADQRNFQLRDAILSWTLEPQEDRVATTLHAGHQALPLGYELMRSSGDREMPERMIGTQRIFNGERFRSVYMTKALNANFWAWGGFGGSLTSNDPEQSTTAFSRAGRHAGFGGIRYDSPNISAGVAYFEGERPSVTGKANSAAVQRKFWFADFAYIGFLVPQLVLRGEAWIGRDRVPNANANASATAKDMSQWHAQLLYNVSERNQIFGRYGIFDPDDNTGNNSVREYGVGWRYYINPGASVTFSYEWVKDLGISNTKKTYEVATLRYQFRF